jgi:hypothetical protein
MSRMSRRMCRIRLITSSPIIMHISIVRVLRPLIRVTRRRKVEGNRGRLLTWSGWSGWVFKK